MGEIFSIDVSVGENDSYCGSDNKAIEEHEPNETLVGRPGVDVVFTALPSVDHNDHMFHNPLNIFHLSPSGSLPSHSLEYHD